jgi:glycosyltransferase involved in cell wall biosynthesis
VTTPRASAPISLSVVVPAYNEARRIIGTLETLCAYLHHSPWSWEIRVIDDGSTDETARLAEAIAAIEPRVVVQREPHRGKGGAVKAGLCAAGGGYRFMCDADLSMPVDLIERFLPPFVTGADVIIATREGAGATRVNEPEHRHIVGRAFNLAVRGLLLPGIHDSQCGFKMFTAAAVAMIFPAVSVSGLSFDLEVLAIARARDLRVVEVPIEWRYREDSKVRLTADAVSMFRDLLEVRRRARSGAYKHPVG